jgi:RNA polymerase sigma factor (sigma-70 family)
MLVLSMETELLTQILSGDRRALEQVLLSRVSWMTAIARRKVPNLSHSVTPEDVVQEAIVRVLKGFSSLSPETTESGFFQWLSTIVEHAAVDAVRTTSRRQEVAAVDAPAKSWRDSVDDLLVSLAVADDPRASVMARSNELSQAFQLAIAKMEPKYRAVIQGLYFDNLSVEELADRMQITTASVRGIRQRAREKIKSEVVELSNYV